MTPAPDHPVIKEWIFARDILRRTGFQPEDIYFLAQPKTPGSEIFVVLKTQERQFNWCIGIIANATPVELERFYGETLIGAWRNGTSLWKDDEFFASESFGNRVNVLSVLLANGFHIPGRVNC